MATFKVTGREQKLWNASTGTWEQVPPYDSSKTPSGMVFGVRIVGGEGETDDAKAAVELADAGYIVTPDPHPQAQEEIAREIAAEMGKDSDEYKDFVADANKWRAAHGVAKIAAHA